MDKFTKISGTAAPLLLANINTDAISPMAAGRSAATDLGAMLFANWRYDADGREKPDFVLNQLPFRHSSILVGGTNFGCGSSRERAVWSLMRFGLRCIIAPSFGEIFHENALQNGLLPDVLPAEEITFPYLGTMSFYMPRERRQEGLRRWGFECACAACGGGEEGERHERRRAMLLRNQLLLQGFRKGRGEDVGRALGWALELVVGLEEEGAGKEVARA